MARVTVGQDARTADFFAADEGRAPVVLLLATQKDARGMAAAYAPGDEPNPKNPGGISDRELGRRQNAALVVKLKAEQAASLAAAKIADGKRMEREQAAAADAASKRSGGILGDLKVIGKGVASTVAVVAKVAGTVAAVVPGGQLIGAGLIAVGAGVGKLASGDLKGAALAGISAAAPAVGGLVQAAAPVVGVVKDAAAILKPALPYAMAAAGVVDQLNKGASLTAAVVLPAVRSLVGDPKNLEGLRVLADKTLAAVSLGGTIGAQATALITETTRLANAGDKAAQTSLQVLGEVYVQRKAVAPGVEQVTTTTGRLALASFIAGATGLQTVALPSSIVVRSEMPATAFVQSLKPAAAAAAVAVPVKPAAVAVPVKPAAVAAPVKPAAAGAAPVKPAAAGAAPVKPAVAASAAARQTGFVVTPAARILDGTEWLEDAAGVEGLLVRTTGPAALRRDATVRRWGAA